ncbi:MAG: hypothetical protein QXE66_05465 [Desulfurococcaceae archaeon]
MCEYLKGFADVIAKHVPGIFLDRELEGIVKFLIDNSIFKDEVDFLKSSLMCGLQLGLTKALIHPDDHVRMKAAELLKTLPEP